MNSIPEVQDSDGRVRNELGKEIAMTSDLLRAFRKAGATRKDLRKLCEMPEALEFLLYRARGIIPPEERDFDMLMNLDADPGIEAGYGGNAKQLIVDRRLGMWVMEINRPDGYFIGDSKIVFLQPRGFCMSEGVFSRIDLGYIEAIDLNAQAATALSQNFSVTQGIFTDLSHPEDSDWHDEKIFFLGTIWRQRALKKGNSGANHGWDICAKALVCDKDGPVGVSDEPLPTGRWPDNYYIAVLGN